MRCSGDRKLLVDEIDSTVLALAESFRLTKFQLSELFVQGPGKDVEHYRKTIDSLGGLVAAFAETVVFYTSPAGQLSYYPCMEVE